MTEDPTVGDSLARRLRRVDSILEDQAEPEFRTRTAPGSMLGGYRLIQRLGAGGMGVVWLARDDRLDRWVAVKELAPHLTFDVEAIRRFGQEAAAAARLDHPGIVSVHTAGDDDQGHRYLVLEFVDGVGLDHVLAALAGHHPREVSDAELQAVVRNVLASGPCAEQAFPAWVAPPGRGGYVERVADWGRQLAEALAHAHQRGVLHRDIKPSNVLVDRSGRVRIVDFGLARIEEAATLTRTGAILGTLTYMAPEALGGNADIDARADVYALGATLYELLSFRPPFEAASISELIAAIQRGTPTSISRAQPSLSPDLAAIVSKCLEPDRADRYATAQDLAEDLHRFARGESVHARGPSLVRRTRTWVRRHPTRTLVAGLVLLAAAGAGVAWRAATEARFRDEVVGIHAAAETSLAAYRAAKDELDALYADYRSKLPSPDRMMAAGNSPILARLTVRARELEFAVARHLDEGRTHLERAALLEAQEDGAPSPETEDALARYYLLRMEAAIGAEDVIQAPLFAEAVRKHDPKGRYSAAIAGLGSLRIDASPSEAVLHLFRYEPYETVRTADEVIPRLVPVPATPTGLCRSGAWTATFYPGDPCLVVTEVAPGSVADRAGVVRGDLVVAIDGSACGSGLFVAEVLPDGRAAARGVTPWLAVHEVDHSGIRSIKDWRDAARAPPGVHEATFMGRNVVVPRGEPLSDALGVTVVEPESILARKAPAHGGTLRVLHDGVVHDIAVPGAEVPGIMAERSAYPLILAPENRPAASKAVPTAPGSYLLLVRAPGREDQRVPFEVGRGDQVVVRVALLAEGTTPPGFVWIPDGPCWIGGDPSNRDSLGKPLPAERIDLPGFFIRRTEVTNAEYFEFLNAPDVRARIVAARSRGETILVPRHYDVVEPLVTQAADGSLVPTLPPDAPVLGLSRTDAESYLTWRNGRAAASGDPWTWALPESEQWEKAARGADRRLFPWGNRLDANLCVCLADRSWLLDVSSRFEPCDESPYGVADMAGSRREWCRTSLKGGSWADVDERLFRIPYNEGLGAGYYNYSVGFRVVARRRDAPR